MRKVNINIIEENFKEYFDTEWLVNKIENGGYANFQYGHKVAIDLTTNEVWCMQNNEYSPDSDVEYFSLPKYIPDYCEILDRAINWGEYSKNKTLKGFIKDQFEYLGHFCMNEDYFYLEDELLKRIEEIKIEEEVRKQREIDNKDFFESEWE